VEKRLVTVATFDQPAQARLAENALKDAGIRAAVSDDNLVGMDWLLSYAVRGVKVQVWEEDADRAVAVLEQNFGEHGEGLGTKISEEELAAQAEAAGREDEDGEDTGPEVMEPEIAEPAPVKPAALQEPPMPWAARGTIKGIIGSPKPAKPLAPPATRDEYARRLVFTSVLGLFFPPVAAYAVYLLLNAAFGEGELSERGRLNMYVGGAMAFAGLAWFSLILRFMIIP
jgi:putative signal transducing protein